MQAFGDNNLRSGRLVFPHAQGLCNNFLILFFALILYILSITVKFVFCLYPEAWAIN
jgi:hypothetical protein